MLSGIRSVLGNIIPRPNPPLLLEDVPRSRGGAAPRSVHQRPVGMAFTRSRAGQKPEPEAPPFSLEDVAAAISTDSFLFQAVSKYVDLIFKEGWWLESRNEKAKEYIRQRLAFLAEATRVPTVQFFWEIAEDLVKYHNVFIAKVRSPHAIAPPGFRIQGLDGKHPIGGYFVLPPTTMKIRRRPNGEVVGYQQVVPGQEEIDFSADQIIHIAYRKERGHAFGTPSLLTVIDDVRMLRELEYNISRLFYLHLHPLFTLTIGKDEQGLEPTAEEIELAKTMMRDIELGGVLFLPGDRYKIDVVGAREHALNAEWALKYMERRVLSGIGVPETAFGRSESANRATADQLTAEMHDRAKALQQVISLYVEEFIFKELLLEAGFDPLLDPDSKVSLVFNEIRTDEIIKKENHAIWKYEHNAITFDEMRRAIGLEPLSDEEKKGLHLYQVTLPRIEAGKASDDDEDKRDTDNKVRPRNQHGVKAAPDSRTKVAASFEDDEEDWQGILQKVKNDINQSVLRNKTKDLGLIANLAGSKLRRELFRQLFIHALDGLDKVRDDARVQRRPQVSISLLLKVLERETSVHVESLLSDWIDEAQVARELKEDKDGMNGMLEAAAKRAARRVQAIVDVAQQKAFWYAYASGAKELGRTFVLVEASGESCAACRKRDGERIELAEPTELYNAVPPFHPQCRCRLTLPESEESSL